MRTFVYVDGLNLYYRALKRRPAAKWLDIRALCEELLPQPKNLIETISYYTAPVSASIDHGAYARQHRYLAALKTIPGLTLHYGRFSVRDKWRYLSADWNDLVQGKVKVRNPEEKGSDVNLGVHLVRDACQGKFDAAAVVTNDTDLTEPIRIVVQEFKRPVVLISPVPDPAGELVKASSILRRLSEARLLRNQLPSPIPGKPRLVRPIEWNEPTA